MSTTDRRDKLVTMQVSDFQILHNKCCRSTRKKHKRMVSKAIRRDVSKRIKEEQ